MWIRSQDRKKLTEIHDVTIYHDKQIWAGCSFALVTFVKGKDKEGNEIDAQKPISYHTTLESALQSYSNNRMADLVSNVDLDLKQVKQAINELREELTIYA